MEHIMEHPVARPVETRPTVIEVRGEPLGVVVPSGERFRFVAVKLPVFGIDGMIFDTVEEARKAAGEALRAE
jgi:hypothetical protein